MKNVIATAKTEEIKEGKIAITKQMKSKGMKFLLIQQLTGLSQAEINKL